LVVAVKAALAPRPGTIWLENPTSQGYIELGQVNVASPMLDSIIVIPCYNEERRLPINEFRAFADKNPRTRFLMVDDGSRDGTLDILRRLENGRPASFDVIRLERNLGKAEAVRRGILRAFEGNSYSVGYWDADLATPLWEIPRFQEALKTGEALIIFGARVKLMGWDIKRRAPRHYVGRIFATLASLSLELPIYDTQCGAKLFRNIPEMKALFDKPFVSRWVFDVEILARLIRMSRMQGELRPDRTVVELPLLAWSDVPGSKVSPIDFFRGIVELGKVRRRYIRSDKCQE
jgi:dolichyl-phosphate beta-glucosyltransferase